MIEKRKTCAHCGKEYPATHAYFYRNNAAPSGLQSWCIECVRERGKGRRHKRKETKAPSDNPLANYTPRQLMTELKRRGYKGKLLYTQEIDLERL